MKLLRGQTRLGVPKAWYLEIEPRCSSHLQGNLSLVAHFIISQVELKKAL
jgi:hypothetical protein